MSNQGEDPRVNTYRNVIQLHTRHNYKVAHVEIAEPTPAMTEFIRNFDRGFYPQLFKQGEKVLPYGQWVGDPEVMIVHHTEVLWDSLTQKYIKYQYIMPSNSSFTLLGGGLAL